MSLMEKVGLGDRRTITPARCPAQQGAATAAPANQPPTLIGDECDRRPDSERAWRSCGCASLNDDATIVFVTDDQAWRSPWLIHMKMARSERRMILKYVLKNFRRRKVRTVLWENVDHQHWADQARAPRWKRCGARM
jgi:hypothetical protein